MTILDEDLKLIKTVLLQKRGGYHISKTDKVLFEAALERIKNEAKEITL